MGWLRYGCAVAAVAAAGTFGAPTAALAQDYPTRPIRLLVVTAAGGLMDVAARVTAEHVGKALGQSIVIENRPGGGGNLGAEAIAKAPPDGYTIGLIQLGNVAINPHIYPDLTFDPLNDLALGIFGHSLHGKIWVHLERRSVSSTTVPKLRPPKLKPLCT